MKITETTGFSLAVVVILLAGAGTATTIAVQGISNAAEIKDLREEVKELREMKSDVVVIKSDLKRVLKKMGEE